MGALLAALVPVVVAAVVLGLLLLRGRARLDTDQNAWRELAANLNLIWTEIPEDPGVGRVSGTLDGFTVSIWRERLQSAAHPSRRWPVTRVRTELGLDLGVGMATATRKVGGGWMMKAGLQPKIPLEDPVFELTLLAHAADPTKAAAWLGPEARAALLDGSKAVPGYYLDDTGILTEFEGVVTDKAKLSATARGQVALAAALRRAWGR